MVLNASRHLVRKKGRQFWQNALSSADHDPRQTWQQLDLLLGNKQLTLRQPARFSAVEFHQDLYNKIAAVRDKTSGFGLPDPGALSTFEMRHFTIPSMLDVFETDFKLCLPSTPLDPLSTFLLKASIETLAPFITELLARSLSSGEFLVSWQKLPRPQAAKLR